MPKVISEQIMDFMVNAYANGGSTTFRKQTTYDNRLSFFIATDFLRALGMITDNKQKYTNEKLWALTEKGKKFAILSSKFLKELKAMGVDIN